MASKNFVVHNGLTVGPLTIDAVTGDIVTSGNLTLSGGGSIAVSNVAVSSIALGDSSINIADSGSGSTVYITVDGTTEHTVDADGVNLASGDRYAIAGTSVLNATTLGTGVVNSSLTTVGTLVSLAVTGNVSAANYTGTLQTAAQPNITSVGNVTSLSASGVIQTTGVVWGNSGVGGSLLTAAQTNVTSLGNLTSLASSGTIRTTGVIFANTAMYIRSALVATTDDATALAIALG